MTNLKTIRTAVAAILLAAPAAAFAHTPAPSHQRTIAVHDRTPQAHIRTISAHQGR